MSLLGAGHALVTEGVSIQARTPCWQTRTCRIVPPSSCSDVAQVDLSTISSIGGATSGGSASPQPSPSPSPEATPSTPADGSNGGSTEAPAAVRWQEGRVLAFKLAKSIEMLQGIGGMRAGRVPTELRTAGPNLPTATSCCPLAMYHCHFPLPLSFIAIHCRPPATRRLPRWRARHRASAS